MSSSGSSAATNTTTKSGISFTLDAYKCAEIDPESFASSGAEAFERQLAAALAEWREAGVVRGLWLRLPMPASSGLFAAAGLQLRLHPRRARQ